MVGLPLRQDSSKSRMIKGSLMKIRYNIQISLVLIISLIPTASFALSELSEDKLKRSTAQSGIGIVLDSVLIETWDNGSHTISNPDDPSSYITFSDLHTIIRLSAGASDTDGDGYINAMTIDLGTVDETSSENYGQAYLDLRALDWDQKIDFEIGNINIAGFDVGSFSVSNWSQPSFEFFAGAHDCGFDLEFRTQTKIETISFNYNQTDSLTLSGLTLCDTFTANTSDDPSNPSTWSGNGMFITGDLFNNNPMIIDIISDDNENWIIERDPADGGNYTVPNPRNGSGFVSITTPVKGSVRMENINIGGTDFGPLAIDGINLMTHIEFPGRGLGK